MQPRSQNLFFSPFRARARKRETLETRLDKKLSTSAASNEKNSVPINQSINQSINIFNVIGTLS